MPRKKVEPIVIALDIGSNSVRMVKGRKEEGKLSIFDFAFLRFPSGEGKADFVSGQIKELLSSAGGGKKASIHSTISGRKLCVRIITLPLMPEAELHQALRSKIRKFVSADMEQVVFSYSVLGQIREQEGQKLEVVFAALQKSLFDEYLQYFNLANVQPEVITSACFGGWNLIREIGLHKGLTSLMLINIDTQETDLTVYSENRFVFTRNIPVGGRDFIDKLKGSSRFSLDKPEDVKLLWGMEEGLTLPEAERDELHRIRKSLQEEADIFSKEIGLTASHYYQITHGAKIEKCIVLGEGAQVGGLLEFLRQKLEIPVEGLHIRDDQLVLPADKREAFKKNLSLYSQALGALVTAPEEINLAREVRKPAKRVMPLGEVFAARKLTLVTISIFVLVGILLVSFFKGFNLYYQHRIKSYRMVRDQLKHRTQQLLQIRRKADILDAEKRLYLRLRREHPPYPVIIAEICKAMPVKNIVLDELKFTREERAERRYGKRRGEEEPVPIRFEIAGRVTGAEIKGAEVTRFVLALEKSGYFENISVSVQKKAAQAAGAVFEEEAAFSAEEPARQKVKELSFTISGLVRVPE